jgi:hypothetical protein
MTAMGLWDWCVDGCAEARHVFVDVGKQPRECGDVRTMPRSSQSVSSYSEPWRCRKSPLENRWRNCQSHDRKRAPWWMLAGCIRRVFFFFPAHDRPRCYFAPGRISDAALRRLISQPQPLGACATLAIHITIPTNLPPTWQISGTAWAWVAGKSLMWSPQTERAGKFAAAIPL